VLVLASLSKSGNKIYFSGSLRGQLDLGVGVGGLPPLDGWATAAAPFWAGPIKSTYELNLDVKIDCPCAIRQKVTLSAYHTLNSGDV